MTQKTNESIAITLLGLAAELAPTLALWLRDLSSGRDDDWSLRVRDILPERSQSRDVQIELERRQEE